MVSSIPTGGNFDVCWNLLKPLNVYFVQKCQICVIYGNLKFLSFLSNYDLWKSGDGKTISWNWRNFSGIFLSKDGNIKIYAYAMRFTLRIVQISPQQKSIYFKKYFFIKFKKRLTRRRGIEISCQHVSF